MRDLPPPVLVQTPAAWQNCLETLRQENTLAVDTEANSLYAYREQVCLIQISTCDQDFVIDPLAVTTLDGLGEIMADPKVEKIFHAAEYDLLGMKRDFGYNFSHLFDTMLAARVLGWEKVGLASILMQEYGVTVNKRYQRANWGRRPLSPDQISYARQDSHYLIPLRVKLKHDLERAGRLKEAQDSFAQIATVEPAHHCFSPDDFWHLLNGRYQLVPQQHAVLRELYIFREREAQRRNLPPFKILSNRTLVELAEALPHYEDEFQGIHGLTTRTIKRYGKRLLRAIKKGIRATPPDPPRQHARPPEAVVLRYDALHQWRKKRAARRGVESDVIVSKRALWEIARRDPKSNSDLNDIKALGAWQRERYGMEMLEVLDKIRSAK